MNLLVCYDVSTIEAPGRRRLHKVAKACEAFGQRVQNSVFECTVQAVDYERLRQRLIKIIEPDEDSLRIYRLATDRERVVEVYGLDKYRDMNGPLIF